MPLILVTDTNPGVAQWGEGSSVLSENGVWKEPVQLSTLGLGDIALVPAPATIDGVAVVTNDRVAVVDQASGAQNGIYRHDGTNLVRADDFPAGVSDGVKAGVKVYVQKGTANNTKTVALTAPTTPITVGTTATTWAEDGGGGGGETLAQTLVLGNTTGGTAVVVSTGDEIRSPGTTAGQGLRWDDGNTVPSLLFGNVSMASGQLSWLVGGDAVTISATTSWNAYPSIIWADTISFNATSNGMYGSLVLGTHTWGAAAFAEHMLLIGTSADFVAGGSSGFSMVGAGDGGANTIDFMFSSICWGSQNSIDNMTTSFLIGESNHVVASIGALIIGTGNRYDVSSNYGGAVIGNNAWANRRREYVFDGSHSTGNVGQMQFSFAGLGETTTNATETELSLGLNTASVVRYVLHASSTVTFTATIVGYQTGGAAGTAGDTASWRFKGTIRRDGANNTAMAAVYCDALTSVGVGVGAGTAVNASIAVDAGAAALMAPSDSIGAASAWRARVNADDVNESLQIRVTGEANKNITWECRLDVVEAGVGTTV